MGDDCRMLVAILCDGISDCSESVAPVTAPAARLGGCSKVQ